MEIVNTESGILVGSARVGRDYYQFRKAVRKYKDKIIKAIEELAYIIKEKLS